MTPSPVHSGWDNWSHPQQSHNTYMMSTPAYPQYDPRVVTSAPLVAPTMAPQYVPAPQYGVPALPSREPHYAPHGHYSYHTYEQQHHALPMQYSRYTPPEDRNMAPIPQHSMIEHRQQMTAPPTPTQDYKRRSGSVRSETTAIKTPDPMNAKDITYNKPVRPEELELTEFKTPIDIMMKAIQGKDSKDTPATPGNAAPKAEDMVSKVEPASPASVDSDSVGESSKGKKYRCPFDGCSKSFNQSTHLETHKRAHTGEKPYRCEWPDCNRSFSQPGNLKTHHRLHTGERPFKCEQCDATFAQRGNLTAHNATHLKTKPFACKLDECNKFFTTRGNLKNHQNKYHKLAIQELLDWVVSLTDVDALTTTQRNTLTYFSGIYKNSNKGIKGRGRDRRVSGTRSGKRSTRDTMSQKIMMMPSQLDVMGY